MIHIPTGSGVRSIGRAAVWVVAVIMAIALACVTPPAHAADENSPDNAITVEISDVTAVVTADSGYHIALDIINTTQQALREGTIALATNTHYTFVSRNDIQQWAQSEVAIPTPDVLAETATPAIAPGSSATVSIDVPADNTVLSSIVEWGPKPLQITLQSDDSTILVHSFLTRSADGLYDMQTPAMDVTVVMPLTGTNWQVDDDAVTALLSQGTGDASQTASVPALDNAAQNQIRQQTQVLNSHPGIQVIADPTYLDAMAMPVQSAAIMQPAGFDITAYADSDTTRYTQAGVNTDAWNADAALTAYRQALGDDQADISTVAWQGTGDWTLQALTTAREQGYDTVVASNGFDDDITGTVHTATYVVNTEAGEITVLSAQPVLSGLAQGTPTSDSATAEQTSAGRLARFVAQSAFYQMEQPYTSRNLLICLDSTTDWSAIDELLSAIEQSPWLRMTDINTLRAAEPYATGDASIWAVPTESGIDTAQRNTIDQALSVSSATHAAINRVGNAVLADNATTTKQPDQDVQTLTRHDTNSTVRQPMDTSAWLNQLQSTNQALALHALSSNHVVQEHMITALQTLDDRLTNAVAITPIESVNVVSETASMPVTISNTLPYPVHVQVSAKTDSMTIVTERLADAVIPAASEEQITVAVRVSTSGSATVQLSLLDRNGESFGATQTTTITSALQINDMSGLAIIIFAVLLGIVGLWRQFHRVKDPDE